MANNAQKIFIVHPARARIVGLMEASAGAVPAVPVPAQRAQAQTGSARPALARANPGIAKTHTLLTQA